MILLQEKIADIIDDAARVVARYTLPFLNTRIGDSTTIDNLEVVAAIDHDSYMKSVNALLRTHSVIGQILSGPLRNIQRATSDRLHHSDGEG